MTSMPASRRARAITLAPRSWPSSPGLATSTRMGRFIGLERLYSRKHTPKTTAGNEVSGGCFRRFAPHREDFRSLKDFGSLDDANPNAAPTACGYGLWAGSPSTVLLAGR